MLELGSRAAKMSRFWARFRSKIISFKAEREVCEAKSEEFNLCKRVETDGEAEVNLFKTKNKKTKTKKKLGAVSNIPVH